MRRFKGKKPYCYKPNKYTGAADSIRDDYYPVYAGHLDQLGGLAKADWIAHESAIPNIGKRIRDAGDTHVAALVWYLIPKRDLGSHSAGGAENAAEYRELIAQAAAQISGECMIILEPDALAMIGRMGSNDAEVRYELLRETRSAFEARGAVVYCDAGSGNWIPADTIAERLVRVGATNFSLNTSMTQYTKDEHAYAQAIRAHMGIDAHYVIDTGRNGKGPFDQYAAEPGDPYFVPPDTWDFEDAHWLNSPGRGIGARPTLFVSHKLYPGCDGYLMVKGPGGSDGVDSRGHGEPGDFDLWEALALRGRAHPKFAAPV